MGPMCALCVATAHVCTFLCLRDSEVINSNDHANIKAAGLASSHPATHHATREALSELHSHHDSQASAPNAHWPRPLQVRQHGLNNCSCFPVQSRRREERRRQVRELLGGESDNDDGGPGAAAALANGGGEQAAAGGEAPSADAAAPKERRSRKEGKERRRDKCGARPLRSIA